MGNMNNYLPAVISLVVTVTARPDGPGGHHGGHHGAHHTVHHSAGHRVTHGAHHVPITTVNLGSHHHSQNPVHAVHSVQPVHHVNVVAPAPVVVKSSPKTIADLVSTNPKFSTLLAAVKAAGLVDTLAGEGPFTVFAPTNTAFEKVPA